MTTLERNDIALAIGREITEKAIQIDTKRNAPCPCGSGKKYKRCCAPKEEVPKDPAHPNKSLYPEIDGRLEQLLEDAERGQRESVQQEIETLLAQYPNYHLTSYAMGVYVAVACGKPAEAIPFFERAVELCPEFSEAHFNLGGCYLKKYDLEKSVYSFRAAREHAGLWDDIGQKAKRQLRSLENLVVKISNCRNLNDYIKNKHRFDQAFEAMMERRFEEAINLFNEVVKWEPNHVQSFGNLAMAYAGIGQRKNAMACFDKALAFDPQYEPAIVNREVIRNMQEGEPFVTPQVREINYYGDYSGKTKGTYIQEFFDGTMQDTVTPNPKPGSSPWLKQSK